MITNTNIPFTCTMTEAKDKERNLRHYIKDFFNKTSQIFIYENLPEGINKRELELIVQRLGFGVFFKYQEKFYFLNASLGGEPDVNYFPTVAIVSNPVIGTHELNINKDCVIINNDSLYEGLFPNASRYASYMVETDLSLHIATINSRIINLISAGDTKTANSAEEFINKVKKGDLGVIYDNKLLDEENLTTLPYNTAGTNGITNLIELRNYWESCLYKSVGLNQVNNFKRESLNDDEINANDDTLFPIIDDMLEQRQIAINKINELFGLNITVSLSSSWLDNKKEMSESYQEETEEETETTEEETETTEEETETNEAEPETNEEETESIEEIKETIEEIQETVEEIIEEVREEDEKDED